MKTYEEMARDVLKRRDEELSAIQNTSQLNAPPEVVYPGVVKKRNWIPKIAIPCAAAVLVGVVGLNVWKNVRGSQKPNETMNFAAENDPNTPPAEEGDYTFQNFVREEPESIYKGGKTEININETEYWNLYHLPALLENDRVPIADDQINNYYEMEFDRLTRVYPEWTVSDGDYAYYAHDEDDGFVASHRIIHTTNAIGYTTNNGDYIAVAASITPTYESATVENAKPSVINGFDAMVYSCVGENNKREYAADIKMGISTVQIQTRGVSEEEFRKILDVYTAPDKDVDNDHNQTMEDKIVILDEAPSFVKTNAWPFSIDTDESREGAEHVRYSMSELNDFYGINFGCLSELHPDWLKMYTERSLGIYVHYYDDIKTENMTVSGGRAIVWTKNTLEYQTTEGDPISLSAMVYTLSDEDIGSSVVNGYNAVIFRKYENYGEVWRHGAAIQMNWTLVFITTENQSDDAFIDLVREYVNEASKFKKSSNPAPEEKESTEFKAVDPIDDRITYEVSWDVESCWWSKTAAANSFGWSDTENSEKTLGYLEEFFRTDMLPVDEQYKGNFERYLCDGRICCLTAEDAKAYSPVDGKVVGACYGYNNGLGNSVAVEFGDGKYFIIGHLDEVNVEVGDTVEAGDTLGVCGLTGAVALDEGALLTMLVMQHAPD